MTFSDKLSKAVCIAQSYAFVHKNNNICTEGLLYGLIQCNDKQLTNVLKKLKINSKELCNTISEYELCGDSTNNSYSSEDIQELTPTPLVENILIDSQRLARHLNKQKIDVMDVFIAILKSNSSARGLLEKNDITIDKVVRSTSKSKNKSSSNNLSKYNIPDNIKGFFNNISAEVNSKDYEPLFVRKADYNSIFATLSKKFNSNIIITGEVGVGKRYIAHEIVRRISKKQCPSSLYNKVVLEINLNLLISGTKYRGDFEGRVDAIIKYLKDNPNIIIYFDDLSLITRIDNNANLEEHFTQLFNIDTTQFISVCDIDDYREYIEDIKSISSRFEEFNIQPTEDDETIEIIKNCINVYEKHHKLKYRKETIKDVVYLSNRYIIDSAQPRASLDLIDEAGAYVNILNEVDSEEIINLDRGIDNLEKQKIEFLEKEDFNSALDCKNKQDEIRNKINDREVKQKIRYITSKHIKDVIYNKTGIPANHQNNDLPEISVINKNIKDKFISQTHAVESILTHFKRVKAGLQDPNRPLASFLFLGPTGVGKTHLCEIISNELFQGENSLLKLDMSEYMEKHSISKIIGSPPGYIGYGQKSILCNFVKDNPYSLILLDEIEKAHRDILNIFLQILDKGELTDSSGRNVSFKNTIIVFTSNIGSDLHDRSSIGFTDDGNIISSMDLDNSLKKHFSPEFLNRLDDIVRFNNLSENDIHELVNIISSKFIDKLKNTHNIKFIMTDSARDYIGNRGYNKKYGARFLRRYFEREVETKVAEVIINNKDKPKILTCKIDNDTIKIE